MRNLCEARLSPERNSKTSTPKYKAIAFYSELTNYSLMLNIEDNTLLPIDWYLRTKLHGVTLQKTVTSHFSAL